MGRSLPSHPFFFLHCLPIFLRPWCLGPSEILLDMVVQTKTRNYVCVDLFLPSHVVHNLGLSPEKCALQKCLFLPPEFSTCSPPAPCPGPGVGVILCLHPTAMGLFFSLLLFTISLTKQAFTPLSHRVSLRAQLVRRSSLAWRFQGQPRIARARAPVSNALL
uniref:Uncharacterized protein n=1 Tax=Anguilla anguilla TaxID=7936 RepID=A0A0E9WXU3_ANGAN